MKVKFYRLSVLKQLKKYIYKNKLAILFLIIICFASGVLMLIPPKVTQIFIDVVLYKRKIDAFLVVILGLIITYLLRLIFDSLTLFISNRVLNRFTKELRTDIWSHFLNLQLQDYEKYKTGDLKMRLVDDVDALGNFLKDQVVDWLSNVLSFTILISFSLFINYKVTLISLLIFPLLIIINRLIGKGSQRVNNEFRLKYDEYYSFEHNSLQMWKEIKVQGIEEVYINKFKNLRSILAKLGFKNIRFWFYSEVFNDFKSNYLNKAVIYIIGTLFIIKGELTLGSLIMLSECYSYMFASLDGILSKNLELQSGMPYYKRVSEIINMTTKNNCNSDLNEFMSIRLVDTSFKYSLNDKMVINNINLEISKGDFITIVGRSGSGKTTLIKLLTGIYSPTKGDVYINNINLSKVNKDHQLYNELGIVTQDSFLFDISIKDNLLLANSYATYNDLKKVCESVNLWDFIVDLPDGLNTKIGEQGVKLSGGQKQKIFIARALLKKPKLLILDEATSALDKTSESMVDNTLHEISNDLTVIVISHKPSTISKAKRILIMEDGDIIEDGTHEDLINKNELYKLISKGA